MYCVANKKREDLFYMAGVDIFKVLQDVGILYGADEKTLYSSISSIFL